MMAVRKGVVYNLIVTDISELFEAHRSNFETMIESIRLPG